VKVRLHFSQRVSISPEVDSLTLNCKRLQTLHLISITVTTLLLEGRTDLSGMVKITSPREPRIHQPLLNGVSKFEIYEIRSNFSSSLTIPRLLDCWRF
jgi:hypothetical protein